MFVFLNTIRANTNCLMEHRVLGVFHRSVEIHGLWERNWYYAHGQVKLVGKEVDYVLPSLEDPYVMIMVSYMETTSSGQTARANEQQTMYQKIVGENVRYPNQQRVLVNVVDGAGWLARRSDLRKMYEGCHYCLNMTTLGQLEAIVQTHVPRQFFSRQK